jgi:hypothetical protein
MPRDDRFISASEIGTWCYCRKAWQLRQRGCPSSLMEERAAGLRYHESHNQDLRAARLQYAVARLVMLLCALVLLMLASIELRRLWFQ